MYVGLTTRSPPPHPNWVNFRVPFTTRSNFLIFGKHLKNPHCPINLHIYTHMRVQIYGLNSFSL